MTFTNKAARRDEGAGGPAAGRAIRPASGSGPSIRSAARLLRREAEALGFTRQFTIYDEDDRLSLIKRLHGAARPLHQAVSAARGPGDHLRRQEPDDGRRRSWPRTRRSTGWRRWPPTSTRALGPALQAANAMDFDDLLLHPLTLFRERPDRLAVLSGAVRLPPGRRIPGHQPGPVPAGPAAGRARQRHRRGRRRPVDLRLARRRRPQHAGFPAGLPRHPDGAAGGELPLHPGRARRRQCGDHREHRPHRQDAAHPAAGRRAVTLVAAADERDEAEWIVRELGARQRQGRLGAAREMAILYRTNSQSRALEEAFRRAGMPYRIVGAISFYDRREVKDLLAYLRLIANPADDEAFLRAVAVPSAASARPAWRRCSETAARWKQAAAGDRSHRASGSPDLRPNVREAFAAVRRADRRTARRTRGASLPAPGAGAAASPPSTTRRCCSRKGPRAPIAGRTCGSWSPAPRSGPRWSSPTGGRPTTPLERFLAEAALLSANDSIAGDERRRHPHDAAHRQGPGVAGRGARRDWRTVSSRSPARRSSEEGLEEERRLCYVGPHPRQGQALPHLGPRPAPGRRAPAGPRLALSAGAAARARRGAADHAACGRRAGGRAAVGRPADGSSGGVVRGLGRYDVRPSDRLGSPAEESQPGLPALSSRASGCATAASAAAPSRD